MNHLTVRGARQHNLKNISCEIPRDRLVVITGPSGSGKSSLAFDTIYAEGQRRYVESLSAYARQFLEQLAKPDVDSIDGLSPAIAIEQRALARSPRSTVGTVTEIADYLRLLFARVGTPHCPTCGKRIEAQTVQQIVDKILSWKGGEKITILAPICRARRGELKLELEKLRRDGFVRVRVDGQVLDLGDDLALDRGKTHDLDVVVDRIVLREGIKGRVTDSVELALKLGDGRLLVDDLRGGEPVWLSERFACIDCGISLPAIEPRMFSFNGPHGACPSCGGLGSRTRIDPGRIVPDPSLTLRQGAVVAWGHRGSVSLATELSRAVRALGVDPDVVFAELDDKLRQAILFGVPASARKKHPYEGIVPRLEARIAGSDEPDQETEDLDIDEGAVGDDELSRFVVTTTCDVCKGRRLRPEALAVHIEGRNISELGELALGALRELLGQIAAASSSLGARERTIAEPLIRAVIARLGFLIDVGLDYLTLDRSTQTLSGGEGQRIRLATQIGAALVGVLYVLDEPSVGLHARDNTRLLAALRRLVDLGNSVIVVEHDRDTIVAADHLIDMGPGAGVHGGHIVAQGTPAEIMAKPDSVTGPYLSGARRLPVPAKRKKPGKSVIRIVRARAHNLKDITVDIPIGLMTAVTGVSGSGKSTLIIDTLLQTVRASLYRAGTPAGVCDAIEGLDHIDKVISIDQAPIGRSPRSNPATYTGVFTFLRDLFAGLPEARARGYRAGRFSFNVKGGRCEACRGDGVLRVEMHFLPDVFVTCEACGGRRYNRETLEVTYRGLSIADALDLTVEQACEVFDAVPRIRERLTALLRVGLGYIRLGQSATTLSGGEAQRVKLARELARKATGRTLYILDEPTTGLHFTDIEVLTTALTGLRDAGNTVVIIEHNLDVVACTDWVIDMGPEGGQRGGRIVSAGTPETVAACSDSITGAFLKSVLQPSGVAPKAEAGHRGARASHPT
ncbi:MAG: excinuclease ABC subunit UvrA [Deltaproteobacteria bacterium]|nr:excinuclease ABC subunit UvrA [Deltaproteobacteria bacterium]